MNWKTTNISISNCKITDNFDLTVEWDNDLFHKDMVIPDRTMSKIVQFYDEPEKDLPYTQTTMLLVVFNNI